MYIITSAVSGTFGFIFLIIWFLLLIFTLVSILRNSNLDLGNKLLWLVIIMVVPILGSLTYLLIRSLRNS